MPKRIGTQSVEAKGEKQEKEIEIEYIIDKDIEHKDKQNETKTLKNKLKKKETETKKLKKEMKKIKDDYLRAIADKENARKRLEREKNEFYQYALIDLLKELLVVLDNFERAIKSKDQRDTKSFQEGIELIYKQFLRLLIKQGVTPIESKGKKFDPHLHQAFITEESDEVEDAEVIEELQQGYTLHNRLLRPALVKVVVPKKGN